MEFELKGSGFGRLLTRRDERRAIAQAEGQEPGNRFPNRRDLEVPGLTAVGIEMLQRNSGSLLEGNGNGVWLGLMLLLL